MWIFIALLAQFINGSAAVFDKLILRKTYPSPVRYTFWLALTGLTSLVMVPFGFYTPDIVTLILAFVAGISFVIAMLFYFYGLFYGQASNVVILLAAIMPITTLFFGKIFLNTNLEFYQAVAFTLLCVGSVILFFTEHKKVRRSMLLYILTAAIFMSFSNTISKIVFINSNFATGFVWIKIGSVLTAFCFLFFKQVRVSILTVTANKVVHSRLGYLANRLYAGVGSVLLQYAILLGVPALVDATASTQFIVVLVGGAILLKERFRGWILFGKIAAVTATSLGVIWLAVGGLAVAIKVEPNRVINWGVTFSQEFSQSLGLDWKQNYQAILSDLGAKNLRLIAYWDLMQGNPGPVYFDDMDYQMRLAENYGAKVILNIGRKQPRWPECHVPSWANNLKGDDFKKALFDYMGAVVDHYKDSEALLYWQVENEPFLSFGECPTVSGKMLDEEIAFVREKDPKHPILVTDSGEISLWYFAAKRGDVFGTTMYRRVHNRVLGYIDYHLPPQFFNIKESLVRELIRQPDKKFMVIELAGEPWLNKAMTEVSLEDQFKSFDLDFFKDSIRYAKETDFNDYYLWGVEWWYWLKEKQNHPEFWNYASSLMK